MNKFMNWVQQHREMTLTVISGILIGIGIALEQSDITHLAPIAFIMAFLIGGYYSAKEGLTELVRDRHLSVDILMLLATIGAAMIGYWLEGALLIFIFSLSESLEVMATNKSYDAIASLMQLTPDVAQRYDLDGSLHEVATRDLKVGDRIRVLKGEAIPIDGKLLSETGLVYEASLTGEPLPADKKMGDAVIGGTINQANAIDIEVTVENDNTLFAKVIRMVQEAQSSPSKTASFIANIEDIYVKVVLVSVPLFIVLTYLLTSWAFVEAFYRGMVLLTVASPCALIASATPATLSAISRSARNGVLFKGGEALDNVNQVKAIVFDKTGTLTQGNLSVSNAYYFNKNAIQEINQVVKSVEKLSTHPIAIALVDYLFETEIMPLDSVQELTGFGMEVMTAGHVWRIGKVDFALDNENLLHGEKDAIQACARKGMTLVYVSKDTEMMAYFALSDGIKAESRAVIHSLKQQGIRTIMLTGDQEQTAQYIAEQLGIDEVKANCLPADKVMAIQQLQAQYGVVAMVGDGVNDAPALATANVGIAMGSGTDIAMESADVVLMKDDLSQIPFVLELSQRTHRIILQNITFSLSVIVCLIIANVFQLINLPLGVVGHEGSTILVILNGLRLLLYKPKNRFIDESVFLYLPRS